MRAKDKIKYGGMFLYEKLFAGAKNLYRIEGMDYDTKTFRVPRIYKKAIDLVFKNHGLEYSDLGGMEEFKDLISAYEQRLTGTKSNDHAVFVGNGVSSLIHSVVEAVLNLPENKRRSEIIVFAPDYSLFHSAVQYARGTPVLVYAKRKNDYLPTIREIQEKTTSKTAAVLFSNPNNPTGRAFTEKWTRELVILSKRYNFFVLSDEIYSHMLYKNITFPHIAKLKGDYENYVKFFGLSKDRPGMTGMRTGYCIGDNRLFEFISRSQMIKNFSRNVLADAVFFTDIALRYFALTNIMHNDLKLFSSEDIQDYYSTVGKNRFLQRNSNDKVLLYLSRNPNVVDFIPPDGGNCIFFRYYKALPPIKIVQEFINKGLAIYPCNVFNMDAKKAGAWMRICVTKDVAYLARAIAKI